MTLNEGKRGSRGADGQGELVIGYGPYLKPSVVRQIQREGNLVITERDVLLDVIQPDP